MSPPRFWAIAIIVFVALICLLFYSATIAHTNRVPYESFLSIVLTALGVMLATLAILVGLAAIWGFQQIGSQAQIQADRAVEQRLSQMLEDADVPGMIRTHVLQQADLVYSDLVVTRPEFVVDNRPVAKEYPKGDA
ncbi:MAG: hypothetical protein CXZ00_16670 [Acidobacteria bacterium]|nr:MAG: hypothetical protein CXZ00_16670 [Acidobacteriota bacterium]